MPFKVDFKTLATSVDIIDVARLVKLTLTKTMRADCPACDSANAIQIFAETNSFRCHSAGQSGDCIALYAHIQGYQGMYKAALELQQHFGTAEGAARPVVATTPQKPEARTAKVAQPAPASRKATDAFDATAFAEKLQYTDEVEALGISQEAAQRFSIGGYRKKVFFPIRDADGTIVCFIDDKLAIPPQLKETTSTNVVRLKRPA